MEGPSAEFFFSLPRYQLYRQAVDQRAWRTAPALWEEVKRAMHGWSEDTFREIADHYDRKDRKKK